MLERVAARGFSEGSLLSAVDAVSFVLMRRERIRTAFAFDHHFAAAGFRLVG
jgi:predicted nucleic acid-binding protein